MRITIIALAAAFVLPHGAESHSLKSKDWQEGWCAGFKAATDASARNVEYFKGLIGPSAMGDGDTAQTVRTMLQGIDLYVALPPLKGNVTIDAGSGVAIECGN